jgi:spore coat polysaccharide biosynthesis protein SpsF
MGAEREIEPAWAVVAARMGSSRLPGKTLADLAGRPSLWHIIDRLRQVAGLAGVVIATTERPDDDPIRECARTAGARSFSGSSEDVLGRTLAAARTVGARTIVQVTGDCPLVDPRVVEHALATYRTNDVDYVSTVLGEETYPIGLDVEIFATDVLERVDTLTGDPRDREHVSVYIYEHPGDFRLLGIHASGSQRRPDLRLTLDTAEDLAVIRAVYAALWAQRPDFSIDEVIAFLDAHPELKQHNRASAVA